LLLNDRDAPQGMRARAQAYQGLLHAARGVKKSDAGVIKSVTPIIEPADGADAAAVPRDARNEVVDRRISALVFRA